MYRRGSVLSALLAGMLILAACGKGGGQPREAGQAAGGPAQGTGQTQAGGQGEATGGSQKQPVKIGVVVSITGNASSLGVPERNTVQLYSKDKEFREIGGVPVQWIVQDDESDSTKAVVAVKRLIEEEKVAAVVCCTVSPNSMAILETVQSAKVPNISLAAAASIVNPVTERYWVFKTPQNDALMVDVLTDHLKAKGLTRVAFIGFNDAYGDSGRVELEKVAPSKGIEIVGKESFARADTDVTAQLTRLAAAKPDAYVIWAIPPGANVAQRNLKDLGITTPVYQSHGVANPNFLKLGGESVEGTLLPAGKLLVASLLPETDPQKPVLLRYQERYEAEFGQGSINTFGGHALDAMLILRGAIERALAGGAKPDDVAGFRAALRDEIEKTRDLVGVTGIFNYSPDDHHGLDRRAATMVEVRRGQWALPQS